MRVTGVRLAAEHLEWVDSQDVDRSKYIRRLIDRERGSQKREETLREVAERIVREILGDMRPTQAAEETLQSKAEAALAKIMGG